MKRGENLQENKYIYEVDKDKESDTQALPSEGLEEKTDNIEYNEIIFNNVQKIGIGEVFKYKELCDILEQPRYGGNQKKAQLKEFLRYFDFEYNTDTKKYIIKEIHEEPLPPSLKMPANAIYSKHIKMILLSYLLRHKDNNPDGAIYISYQKLYLALGMINQRYIEMQRKDQRAILRNEVRVKCNFSDKVDDEAISYYIKNFYDRCRSKFSSIIKTTLDSLESQNYIIHSKSYHLYKRVLNENNEVVETYYGGYSNDIETEHILEVERTVMDEFGYEKEKDIWFGGETPAYWDRVLELVQELYPEIHAIYRCHKILCTKANVLKALSREQETLEMKQLNEKVLNYIDNQAERNKDKNLTEEDYKKKLSDKYVQAQLYLSDALIKIKE